MRVFSNHRCSHVPDQNVHYHSHLFVTETLRHFFTPVPQYTPVGRPIVSKTSTLKKQSFSIKDKDLPSPLSSPVCCVSGSQGTACLPSEELLLLQCPAVTPIYTN